MKISTTLAATATVAILALAATDLSASAQSATSGPEKLPSTTMAGKQPSRMMMKHRRTSARTDRRPMHYAAARPLVVRPAPPIAADVPVVAGPGALVTGPLGFGSNLVALPFRGLNTIFPAGGDVTTNPLVLIGAPLRAAADLAQVPFRIVGAPFGGTTIATY